MNEWTSAVIVGIIMAAPALIAAVFNYYKNKASITATYQEIASKCASRLKGKIAECDELSEEIKELKRRLMKYEDVN